MRCELQTVCCSKTASAGRDIVSMKSAVSMTVPLFKAHSNYRRVTKTEPGSPPSSATGNRKSDENRGVLQVLLRRKQAFSLTHTQSCQYLIVISKCLKGLRLRFNRRHLHYLIYTVSILLYYISILCTSYTL